MPTDKVNWTTQQKLAINSAGKDVLVTASAGTGKTAVLAHRCAQLLADTADRTDISQILVLTFTNAAADQMQSRIAENLRDEFQKNRTSYLRRQLLTLDAAHISTIHTFCKRTITDNFHRLDMDPAFRIIEQDERNMLQSDILARIIEQAWQDSSLAPGLGTLLCRRNIQSQKTDFLDGIINCSRFLDSVVGRDNWYQRASALTDAIDFSASALAKQQRQIILNKLAQCKSQLEYSQLLDLKITNTGHWTDQIQTDFLEPVNNCIEYLQKDDLDRCAETIRNFVKNKFKNKPKDISSETADLIKAPAQRAIKTLQSLKNLAIINPEYEKKVSSSASLQTRVMIELVKRFDRAYAQAKKKLNCLDFADLEHHMLKLLTESDSTAAALREKFKYIFVDEYQDINPVQQAILDRISRPDNLFVVGDIKQSIYAFRQAQPQIFLARLNRAAQSSQPENTPVRVDLSGNFRSRKAILDFANAIFGRIMTAPAFLVDYDEKAFLKPKFDYEPTDSAADQKPLTEICILNEEQDDQDNGAFDKTQPAADADITNSTQRQAAFIAKRINQMVGTANGSAEFKIYDKKTNDYRDVEYQDIVILMRSPAHRANQYIEILSLAGIPVTSRNQAGYFAATEITDCISLLKVLDNPQQDIDFAAVLRSAFCKITDTDLAMVRKYGDSVESDSRLSFYDCARAYSQNGPDESLRQRLGEVLGQIENWRLSARRQPLADALWQIYRDTGFLSFVQALPNGSQRKANLLKLHERAIQFESFATGPQSTSLARFVEFVEKLLAQGSDWAPAESDNITENAVRIMSIHKSKGLEFPVVFCAELNSRFNKKDSYSDCLIDDDYGLGLQVVKSNVKLPAVAYEVIAEKKLDAMLAEEMRILYVAITRARERLILTASKKASNCRALLSAPALLGAEPVRDWQLKSAQCHFDWLLYALANHSKMHDLFGLETQQANDDNLFCTRLLDIAELNEISDMVMKQKHTRPKLSAPGTCKPNRRSRHLLDRVTESLNWKYPFDDLTKLPAKTSVSKLTHAEDEFAPDDLADAFVRRPRTVSTDKTNVKLVGSATHLVIQSLDLDANISIDSIRAMVEKLVSEDRIAAGVAKRIDCDSISKFFLSDLGKVVTEHKKENILREWPFTFASDAARLGAKSPGQTVIVQGIVDMIIKTPAGLIIIDFKTDNVTKNTAEQYARSRKYYQQMNHYADAASAILKQKTAACQLYFLKPGITIEVPACHL
ncbi:MAG: helicase-exonuclease AddAB subunit AddA [Planctomycetota bacterium]|jgi:ATP-dependent helicase/nuclease subunit A